MPFISRSSKCSLICLLSYGLFPAAVSAEPKTFVELTQGHSITTHGNFRTNVRPDRVHVIFSISSSDKSLQTAYSTNSARAKTLIAMSDALKIEKDDIQTGNIEVGTEYPHDAQSMRSGHFGPIGYTVTRNVSFKLKDVTKLATLLSEGLLHGANGIQMVSYECSDAAKYRASGRLAALKAARDKAIELAESVQCKVGEPLTISEGYDSNHPSGQPFLTGASNGSIGPQGSDATYVTAVNGGIELGQITIDSDVTATFELE